MPDGLRCRAPALRGKTLCYWHDPDKADEAAESRRIGGLHRRKKRTVAAIYGFGGLRTLEDNLALLETISIETLALENSIARNRALTAMLALGVKLIEVGDLAARLTALEATVDSQRHSDETSPFPTEAAQ
jgi:hypothetical protein